MELGEKWAVAMKREVLEETGLVVTESCLLGIYSDPALTITPQPYYDGFHGQFVVATFLVTAFTGEVAPNHEVDDWGWFGLEDLPEPMLRSHPVRVYDALRFKGVPFVR